MSEEQALSSAPEKPPAEPARPVDVKRLLIVAGLIVAGLVYFAWDDVRDVLKPPRIVPVRAPRSAADPQYELKPIRAGALDVTFTRIGAAITHLAWRAPDGHVETLLSQNEVANQAFAVQLPGREEMAVQHFDFLGMSVRDGITEVRFAATYTTDGLKVLKTYRIRADQPLFDLAVELQNIPPDDPVLKKGYTLQISDSVGLPDELSKGDALISVRADGVTDRHPVRTISGVQDWPTEKERRRAGHGQREADPHLEWVATATKYFALIVRPRWPEEAPRANAALRFTRTAKCAAAVELLVPPDPVRAPWLINRFQVYAGPLDYEALAALGGREQEAVNYWYLGRPVTLLLTLIYHKVFPNYGVAIVLVTLVFRLLMWPVSSYNLRSLVDIKVANAKLAEIDAREPPRSERAAHAEWLKDARVWEDVQRKATIGVFLPFVILLPALLVLYYALDASYEFYRQPLFLWITDISKRDPWFVLPALMGLAMMGQQRTMTENRSADRTWIFLPAAFTVLFAFFSAGLVLFWLVDTLVGWGQLALIRRRQRVHAAPAQEAKA